MTKVYKVTTIKNYKDEGQKRVKTVSRWFLSEKTAREWMNREGGDMEIIETEN